MRPASVRRGSRAWQVVAPVGLVLAALGLAPGPARADNGDTPSVPSYGDAGSKELSIGLGAGSGGFAASAGFRYFVVDRVAPGLELGYVRSSGRSIGQIFASVRVVPLRVGPVALVVTGRAGRLLLSGHADGWGLGGDAGLILFLSPNAGLEIGYEMMRLLPATFCADLTSCTLQGPVIGLRLTF